MPKPTTHTDVLVPRPNTDDPAVRAARITLASEFDTTSADINSETVQLVMKIGTTAEALSSFNQSIRSKELIGRVAVRAANAQRVSVQGIPETDLANPPGAGAVEKTWTRPAVNVDELKVIVDGLLGGSALDVVEVPVSAEEFKFELRDNGTLQATVRVVLSPETP